MADAERFEDRQRRQQTDDVAAENDEDADVKKIGSPDQLPPAQQLARSAPPRVLRRVEAQQAAEQEYGETEIRVPAVEDAVR